MHENYCFASAAPFFWPVGVFYLNRQHSQELMIATKINTASCRVLLRVKMIPLILFLGSDCHRDNFSLSYWVDKIFSLWLFWRLFQHFNCHGLLFKPINNFKGCGLNPMFLNCEESWALFHFGRNLLHSHFSIRGAFCVLVLQKWLNEPDIKCDARRTLYDCITFMNLKKSKTAECIQTRTNG